MFVYYFTGNMVFGIAIYELVVVAIDRPIHAFLNLQGDVEEAERNKDYRLEDYLENFKPNDVFDGYTDQGIAEN